MGNSNRHIQRIIRTVNISTMILLLTSYMAAFAQEHPSEHPKEHPGSEKAAITNESLAEAIINYINNDATLKGGFFLVYDREQGKTLTLTLEKVHKDRLVSLGDSVYFACADFSGTDGKVYDLDIFMKDDTDGLRATDISVHKLDGKARYNWVEKDGVWSKTEK